jgi:hypothetical protein
LKTGQETVVPGEDAVPFVDDNLMPGEQVLYRAHVHWGLFAPPLILGALVVVSLVPALLVGGAERILFGGFSLAMFIIAAGLTVQSTVIYFATEFALTDKRIIGKTGFIARTSLEIVLGKIEGIMVNQGILGRMLDYGTIVVTGTGTSRTTFKGISSPLECRRAIQQQIGAG